MSPTTFADFYALGFTRLVPIVPHDAAISEKSSLALRVGTDQDSRGKAVGVKGSAGWYGFDWLPHECDERDLARWQAMGAGIGIKTGAGIVGIDADTLNLEHAALIQMTAVKHFGFTPVRVGRFPKALYLVAISAPMKYTRVEFGELDARGRLKDRVEILSDGRQFVAHGIHPATKAPYTWTRPLVSRAELPTFTPAQILAFLEELRSMLPAARPLISEGSATDISQASLRGTIETVRKAVAATPNSSKAFGTREAYRDYGYAIRAALPRDEPAAFEIFADWCARWEDGTNDPDVVAADWRRMKGPYRRGANWLYELAEQHAPEVFKKVDAYFDVLADDPSPLFEPEPAMLESGIKIKWVDPIEWHGTTPPKRRFRIGGMVPDGEVTLLTGAGGVGKTLLAQQAGTAVSMGLPFLGRVTEQCKVMLFLCEDSEDELQLRQRDICLHMGVDLAELSPVLRIASRKFMDNLLAVWTSNSGAMKRTKVWEALRDDCIAFGAKLTIVDTIADTFGGNEIDRSHVRQFVQACLGKLAQETGGAVLALGHPSKAGQAVGGDGTSGSTAWHASVRSRLYLTHAAKDKTGPMRRLENMKANYGAGGDVFMLKWHRGAFDCVSTKQTAPDDVVAGVDEAGEPIESVASAIPSTGSVIDDALLLAVREAADEGVQLTNAVNSPFYPPKVLRRRSDVLPLYPMDDVEASWERAVKAGRVVVAVVGRKQNRHPIVGFKVASYVIADEAPTQPTAPAGVFE
jgi:AAA domain/Bifunctional DNA primase/polymerase, N-terminal